MYVCREDTKFRRLIGNINFATTSTDIQCVSLFHLIVFVTFESDHCGPLRHLGCVWFGKSEFSLDPETRFRIRNKMRNLN